MSGKTPDVYQGDRNFYFRNEEDNAPVIRNRKIKPVGQCKICSMVPRLQNEKGFTFVEACEVEQDFYRHVYTMWSAGEISKWLKNTYDWEVSHDAISTHVKKHIPDPGIAMLDRVKSYRPDVMNKKFLQHVSDIMRLSVFQFQQDILSGKVRLEPNEFLKMVAALEDWKDILSDEDDISKSPVLFFMEALDNAADKVLDDPDKKQELLLEVRRQLKYIEERESGEE